MATARLEIAYDGSRFVGWAAQPGERTVQAELEAALGRILGEEVALTVAGRTDAGVHATAQVASFEHGSELTDRLAERLNAVLSRDVAVLARKPRPTASTPAATRSRTVLASRIREPFEEAGRCGAPSRRSRRSTAAPPRWSATTTSRRSPSDTEHVLFGAR
jgi:tRNA pseudouridine38-40 synthase